MKLVTRLAAIFTAVALLLAGAGAWAQVRNFDSPTKLPPLNSSVVYSRTLATSQLDCIPKAFTRGPAHPSAPISSNRTCRAAGA